MASLIRLEAHTFTIREKYARGDAPTLAFNAMADTPNMQEIIEGYIKSLKEPDRIDRYKKAISTPTRYLRRRFTDDIVSGQFDCGLYDREGSIYNYVQKSVTYKKKKTDIDYSLYYFLFHAPIASNVGILLTERIGNDGIVSVLQDSFEGYFRTEAPGYKITFQPLISAGLRDHFLNDGSIQEIIFRKYALPPDLADQVGLNEYRQSQVAVELRFKLESGFLGMNRTINDYLADPNGRFFDIPAINGLGLGDADYAVVSNFNGVRRTIDLSENMKLRPIYDVSDDVIVSATGNATFTSIDTAARNLLEDFIE